MATAGLTLKADMANARKSSPGLVADRLLSFAVIAVAPAIVWALAIMAISYLIGWQISTATLFLIGISIFVFLTFICAGMIASGSDDSVLLDEGEDSQDGSPENKNNNKKKSRRAA